MASISDPADAARYPPDTLKRLPVPVADIRSRKSRLKPRYREALVGVLGGEF